VSENFRQGYVDWIASCAPGSPERRAALEHLGVAVRGPEGNEEFISIYREAVSRSVCLPGHHS
jgi:hypothetical protein